MDGAALRQEVRLGQEDLMDGEPLEVGHEEDLAAVQDLDGSPVVAEDPGDVASQVAWIDMYVEQHLACYGPC